MAEIKLSKPSYLEPSEEAKSEDAVVKKVVQGNVTKKKTPTRKRLRESLGLEETRTVGDYLVWDVLLPAAKEMVADLVKKGIDVFLYGGASQNSSRSSRRNGKSYVSYEGYYSSGRNRREPRDDRYRYHGKVMDFAEFVFADKRDADLVLSELCEAIDVYGFAKVSDFYSLVGETERDFTDHGYGWDALGSAYVERVPDGWIVNLPRPIPRN